MAEKSLRNIRAGASFVESILQVNLTRRSVVGQFEK